MRSVAIFGATGSIGKSTLDLIERYSDRFSVSVLTAGSNAELLVDYAKRLRPKHVAIRDESKLEYLRKTLEGTDIEIHAGSDAIADLASLEADVTIAAITGIAGLKPTLNATKRGGIIAIANKESLVAAGELLCIAASRSGATLLPIDSEHNAIHQVLAHQVSAGRSASEATRIMLTASGGPFWEWSCADMKNASPKEALKHPNWSMGDKVSVDSATMMNKGLEVIEAGVLFGFTEEQIEVSIHRQSLLHGMVCYGDGSVVGVLSEADMRVSISYALAWPERLDWHGGKIDLKMLSNLTFEEPDSERFPCLDLAREAMRKGGLAPAGLSAGNEVAAESFLAGEIGFLDIGVLNRHILESVAHPSEASSLEDILRHDEASRQAAREWIEANRS